MATSGRSESGHPTSAIHRKAELRSRSRLGIDTLTAAFGHDARDQGSGCDAAPSPGSKRLGPKRLEDAARKKVALDIEGVLDGGVDRQEALG